MPRSRLLGVVFTVACVGLAGVALPGCRTSDATSRSTASTDGMMIHIRSGPDRAHDVLMALRMAQMMAADRPVLVYVDVDGIGVVTRNAPELQMAPFGSSKAMLRDLIDRGVAVYACPGCMKAANVTEKDLFEGIRVAQKEAFFNFTRGRIVTLDY